MHQSNPIRTTGPSLPKAWRARQVPMEDLDRLKGKYQSVLNLMNQLVDRLQNLHLQDKKLFLKGNAKTKAESNRIWDQIKLVDKSYSQDLMAQITYDADAPSAPVSQAPKTYTVKAATRFRRLPNSTTVMPICTRRSLTRTKT